MTNEIQIISAIKEMGVFRTNFPNKEVEKVVSKALKALEQEPILDKIKEEIKDNTYFINETTEKEGIDFETVEKIIDKYKAESEG